MTIAYAPRAVDRLLADYLTGLPGLLLVGPRAVGKTTTARQFARSELRLDHPPTAEAVRADPDAALRGLPEPILVDEWQVVPDVLGAVKRAIDAEPRSGRFVVTGSVRGDLDVPTWPGTGRLVRIDMHGLTPAEVAQNIPAIPFIDRVASEGAEAALAKLAQPPDLRGYLELALRSGFPEPLLRLPRRLRRPWLRSYLDQFLTRDAAGLGEDRDPVRLRRYFEALAINTAGVVEHRALYEAAGINIKTAHAYDRLLTNLLVVEAVPAWTTNRLKRLVRTPKRYVCEPALAASVLEADIDAIFRDGTLVGRLLDTFVVALLRAQLVLCDSAPRLYHLRQSDGRHEIDVIIELGARRVVGIEVKTGAPKPAEARHLAWLRDEIGEAFVAGLVLHTGPLPYRLDDRIVAAPIAALWS